MFHYYPKSKEFFYKLLNYIIMPTHKSSDYKLSAVIIIFCKN